MPPSLASVKAEIKTWERAFRAKHDRNPTREDIKARREIADKYSLYKKLVKAAAEGESEAQAAAPQNRSSSSRTAIQPQIESTIETVAPSVPRESSPGPDSVHQESPFQTPKKNKTSDRWRRPANPPAVIGEGGPTQGQETPVVSLNPFLSPAKKPSQTPSLQASLKKVKSYPTPVSDPAHSNPFEDDVVESKEQGTPRKRGIDGDITTKSPSKQAFLFAPSPKRLKSLLEVNSLHASSSSREPLRSSTVHASPAKNASLSAFTPRTRARKRLRGEEVDDTPEKDRERDGKGLKIGSRWAQARSLRLQRSTGALKDDLATDGLSTGNGKDPQSIKRINVWKRSVQEETMSQQGPEEIASVNHLSDEDDDEVFGPTPVKPTANSHLAGGAASAKRLFVDMLPPLEATINLRIPAQTASAPAAAHKQHQDGSYNADVEDSHLDPEGITRTPSKAMSRFMASKPKSAVSPHTAHIDSGMFQDHEPQGMEIVEDGSMDTEDELSRDGDIRDESIQPDATDTDEEELVPLETVDLEDFNTSGDDTKPQNGWIESQKSLAKEIVLSDEEGEGQGRTELDEDIRMDDDRDAASVPRGPKKLRIESYRYTLQQKIAQQRTRRTHNLFDENDIEEMQGHDDGDVVGDELTDPGVPGQPDPFQALSKLSLKSPESKVIRKTMALQQARAKAIFDARTRERLRAAKRAPVYGAGEGMERGDVDGEGHAMARGTGELDPFVEEGDDDDWESDPEGWKATGLPDDDDW